MTSDSIGDLISRIKNGYLARQSEIDVSYSKMKEQLLLVFQKQQFIKEVVRSDEGKKLAAVLLYKEGIPALTEIKRISKPGRRHYVDTHSLTQIHSRLGYYILSTSRGIKTHIEAKKQHMGGELLCVIW